MPAEPLAFFQDLLDDFPALLGKAQRLRTANPADPLWIKAAVVGFGLFHPIQEWGRENFDFVDRHVNDDLSPLAFISQTEECEEAITTFACLGFGAIMGKFSAGEMDTDEASKSEWYLFAFLNVHDEEICRQYQSRT